MGNRQTYVADAFPEKQNNKKGHPGKPQEKDERPDNLATFHGLRKSPRRRPDSNLLTLSTEAGRMDSREALIGAGF